MKNAKVATMAAMLVTLATACSNSGSEQANRPDPEATAAQVQAPALAEADAAVLGGQTVAFGEPFTYKDGLEITVTRPREFRPSTTAKTSGEGIFVKFKVLVANGTTDEVAPTDVSVSVTSGGGVAGNVIDEKQRLIGPPEADVRPGGKTSWVQGFGVLDPRELQVTVQAGIDRIPIEVTR